MDTAGSWVYRWAMNASAPKLAGRVAVAVLLVLVATGTVLAAAATRTATPAPAVAEPAAASPAAEPSARPEKSPKPEKSPEAEKAEDTETPEGSPSPANLARIVERLAAAGIATTQDDLAALATKVGVGGAMRVLRLADASGTTPAEIVGMFEGGMGWGEIVRELKLDIGPGNGSVMGQGKGLDTAAKAAAKAARAEAKAARAAERAAAKAARHPGAGD
jgi:2-oxoglutarate dehydrogenase E2 component (dihydrolipoamide succinyltransferase)